MKQSLQRKKLRILNTIFFSHPWFASWFCTLAFAVRNGHKQSHFVVARMHFCCQMAARVPDCRSSPSQAVIVQASNLYPIFKKNNNLFIAVNDYQVNFLINMSKGKGKWWEVYSLDENFKWSGKNKRKNTRQDNLGLVGDILNVHRGYFQHYFLLLTDGDGTSNYEGNLELFTILLQISW